MIHYHGLPITPEAVLGQAMSGAHFFASFANRGQIGAALAVCSSFAADNGAYPLWRAGSANVDWHEFYEWVSSIRRLPTFDFAVIPDVIDGSVAANDKLIEEWPFGGSIGAPVWHLNEPLERLVELCLGFERVCIGSSGEYSEIGTEGWWRRMDDAMDAACGLDGYPTVKLHGLRMLAPELVAAFPFKSADSTNLARNIGMDGRWTGAYSPPSKAGRAAIMRERIESHHSPERWIRPEIRQQEIIFA